MLPKALVIYDTMWHSTELLAHALAQGLMDAGAETLTYRLRRTHYSDIVTDVLDAGLLLFGSPTLNNTIFPSMGEFLTYLQGLRPVNKAAACFGSYGWSGQAVAQMNQILNAMKFNLVLKASPANTAPPPRNWWKSAPSANAWPGRICSFRIFVILREPQATEESNIC